MTTKAHKRNHLAEIFPPDWRPARTPDEDTSDSMRVGRLRGCSFCGSMHPSDLAAALNAGAMIHWADRKYGWPHKVYADGVPNPHAGMLEVRSGSFSGNPPQKEVDAGLWERYRSGFDQRTGAEVFSYRRLDEPKPARATTDGKFYTEHLQDATPEEAEVIQRAMGLRFTFHDDGGVAWAPHVPPAPTGDGP